MGNRSSEAERLPIVDLGPRIGSGHHPGANKFGAVRSLASDGRRFASKAERDRYHELLLLLAAGAIAELEVQPRWQFTIAGQPLLVPVGTSGQRWQKARYTADFRYRDRSTGELVVEDVKGFARQDASLGLRLGLMKLLHGVTVRLVQPRRLR